MNQKTLQSQKQGKSKKKHRPVVALGLWIIKRIEKILIHYSLVPDTPFLNTKEFDWLVPLKTEWKIIHAELNHVLDNPEKIPNFQDISKDQTNITQDDRWKTFFLYGYGYKFDTNCELCPETTRILESIPGMYTGFFSVLSPGKHIPLHRGPYKGLLRCHLGLKIPEPKQDCWIEVGGERATWQEGECLVFDDTYKHQVQNNTDGTRVVLFIDVIRPLRFPGTLLNSLMLTLIRWSPYIQDARKNQKAWEYRLGEQEA